MAMKRKNLICEMNTKKLEQNCVTEGKLSKMTTNPFVCNDKCFLVKKTDHLLLPDLHFFINEMK